ncbi:MAG: hypothetical protein ACI9BD_001206 [Candidatus Marinamargulisbacteria bacterium]|jgi:hypothetical protein
MVKRLLFFFVCALLVGGQCVADSSDQGYLHSEIDYEFTKPTGNNAAVATPLVGIKTVTYSDPNHLPETVELLERTSQMAQFKCSNCHTGKTNKNMKSPHGRISTPHGKSEIQNCFTCHNEKSRDYLNSSISPKISFNHAAKLCYQCHSILERSQINDV